MGKTSFFFFPLKEERAWSCQEFWVGLLSPYPFILSRMRKEYGRLHCCIRSEYLFLANTLYQLGKADIIKIPHTGWLNINLFSHNSGSQNFKVRCLPVWFLLRPLSLAYRWLLPCCVLTWPLCTNFTGVSLSSKDTNYIPLGLTLRDSSLYNHLFKRSTTK